MCTVISHHSSEAECAWSAYRPSLKRPSAHNLWGNLSEWDAVHFCCGACSACAGDMRESRHGCLRGARHALSAAPHFQHRMLVRPPRQGDGTGHRAALLWTCTPPPNKAFAVVLGSSSHFWDLHRDFSQLHCLVLRSPRILSAAVCCFPRSPHAWSILLTPMLASKERPFLASQARLIFLPTIILPHHPWHCVCVVLLCLFYVTLCQSFTKM